MNSMLVNLGNKKNLRGVTVLEPSMINIEKYGYQMHWLLDTRASECFITPGLATKLRLRVNRDYKGSVLLADKSQKYDVKGVTEANLVIGSSYGEANRVLWVSRKKISGLPPPTNGLRPLPFCTPSPFWWCWCAGVQKVKTFAGTWEFLSVS